MVKVRCQAHIIVQPIGDNKFEARDNADIPGLLVSYHLQQHTLVTRLPAPKPLIRNTTSHCVYVSQTVQHLRRTVVPQCISQPKGPVHQNWSGYPSSRILAFQNSNLARLQTSLPPLAFQRSPAWNVSVSALQASSRSSPANRNHCTHAGKCSLMYFPSWESGDVSSAMAKDLKPSLR
jgi:hypothetical protein